MSNYQYIEVSEDAGLAIIHLSNPLIQDRLLIHELGDELIDYVERQRPTQLLVNFERVTYCSSEVLGSLIRARRRVVADGGKIKLCSMTDDVRRLFKITHLDGTVLDIYDTPDEAKAAF